MSIITVDHLFKRYRTFSRREGVWGSLQDLFKRDYRYIDAVDGISFKVNEGELLGYIGPNGAGKSTSIKMLTGILRPTSGEMSVLGFNPYRDRKSYTKHIGVVFGQRTQLWWDIAVIESFNLLAKIYEVPQAKYRARIDELVEILNLEPLLRRPVRKLSLGERIRCDLTASLIHDPKVLFLDEPTIGLDAIAKDSIRSFLRHINEDFKTTIILTTHDLKEIEELCGRILVIDRGQIIYDGDLTTVKALPGLARQVLIDFHCSAPAESLKSVFGEKVVFKKESERRIVASYNPQTLLTVDFIKEIFENFEVADLTVREPSIDEVVMKIYRDGELKAGEYADKQS